MKTKSSYKVALGGVVGALSIAMMFLTGIIPVGTYAFPCFAGILLTAVVIEINYVAAVSVFISVSILSFLISGDKEACLYYAFFFGFYPIIKSLIERIKSYAVQWIIKISIFNMCMVAIFCLGLFVFSIPKESFNIFGIYLPWVFLIVGNIFFVFYDFCVSKLVTVYLFKWRKNLK